MKQEAKTGMVDYTVLVFIPDPASTDGSGKTGLVAANLTVSYVRVETDNDVTVTDVTSSLNNLAALTTAHTDWGLLEVSSTLAPGLYRLDLADAVFAAGAWSAVVYVMITTSAAAASPMEFVLVPQAPIDGVDVKSVLGTALTEGAGGRLAGGMVKFFNVAAPTGTLNSIPDAVAGASGGLLIAGSNAGTTFGALTVTGTMTLGALTCSGAAAFQSTLAVSGATTFAAVTASGTVTFNAFTVTNAFTIGGVGSVALTSARAGYLDNLNIGGNVASSAEATAIQNNTRVVRVVPEDIELPSAGTRTYRIELLLYDDTGGMEAPDSAPTIVLVNQAGTDRSARLDSATMALVETGRYRAIYTSTAGDTKEQLVWTFSVVEGGNTRKYGNTSYVTDAVATDFTSADRAKLDTLHDTRLTAGRAANLDNLDATVSDLPTNAELATALGTADDAVLAQVALVKVKTDLLPADPAGLAGLASAHGAGSWATATSVTVSDKTGFSLANGSLVTATLGTFVLAKTTNITGFNDIAATAIVSSGAINTAAGVVSTVASVTAIATGGITEASIATPAESATQPTGILGMIRRLWEKSSLKRTRNRTTGAMALRNAADSSDLETAQQSTSGTTDTITKAT